MTSVPDGVASARTEREDLSASRYPVVDAGGSLSDAVAAAEPDARVVATQRLAKRVHRVILTRGTRSSLVVKRLSRVTARKTTLLNSRWLPAVGLQDRGPPLLANAPGPEQSAWQVFEDLGDCALRPDRRDLGGAEAATHLVAQLHVAFVGHSLLPECIETLADLGARSYGDWVRRAARALETIETRSLSPGRLALRDRLSRRLDALLAEEPGRRQRLQQAGGPMALLHGDLWPQNVLLPEAPDGRRARLIDWDHAGVGPISYDLSTFISRFPLRARIRVLRLYERVVRSAGWRLSDPASLNDAFETAEYARLASCLIWPAEAVRGGADWAFKDLEAVDGWFAELRPVLRQ